MSSNIRDNTDVDSLPAYSPQSSLLHQSSGLVRSSESSKFDGESETFKSSTELKIDGFLFILVAPYFISVSFSWIVLNLMGSQLIASRSANVFRLYETVKVINTITAALTIPVTSAVCARAAVAYTQSIKQHLTLRQTMALADEGWSSPLVWWRLRHRVGLQKYSSTFLWLAIGLHVLAFCLFPIQQAFLSQRTVYNQKYSTYTLIPNYWDYFTSNYEKLWPVQIAALRSQLPVISPNAVLSNVWFVTNQTAPYCVQEGSADTYLIEACSDFNAVLPQQAPFNDEVTRDSLGIVSYRTQPVNTYFPPSYNTGIFKQAIPGLSTSISYTNVSAIQFPHNCSDIPGAFTAQYDRGSKKSRSKSEQYSLQVCIPYNVSDNLFPYNASQQLFESMYIEASNQFNETSYGPTTFLIEANTTIGYFELPNFSNNNEQGLFIPQSLIDAGYPLTSDFFDSEFGGPIPDNVNNSHYPSGIEALLPPLLTIAIALFDSSSYIALNAANGSVSASPLSRPKLTHAIQETDLPSSVKIAPFSFLNEDAQYGYSYLTEAENFTDSELADVGKSTNAPLSRWLTQLWSTLPDEGPFIMEANLGMAAYEANLLWLTAFDQFQNRSIVVQSDEGSPMEFPAISTAGVAITSILMSIFLVSILALTIGASRRPVWTFKLDSFAMLRIGASVGEERLPMLLSSQEGVEILDELPGWVGDAASDAETGMLQLGADHGLKSGRGYLSHPIRRLNSEK